MNAIEQFPESNLRSIIRPDYIRLKERKLHFIFESCDTAWRQVKFREDIARTWSELRMANWGEVISKPLQLQACPKGHYDGIELGIVRRSQVVSVDEFGPTPPR